RCPSHLHSFPTRRSSDLALAGYAGRRALLGIRPEDLEDATLAEQAPPEATLSAVTDIREDMGPEVYAHFSLGVPPVRRPDVEEADRKSTRLNSSHQIISY